MQAAGLALAPVPAQEFLNEECRLLSLWALQDEVVETVSDTKNHSHLAHRLAKCHRSFRHWRCENNHDWAEAENSCSVRICPHCSRRRARILADRLEAFTAPKKNLRYLVLAEKNSSDVAAGIASLWEAWTSLRRSVVWKKYCVGSVAALEVTWNGEERTWHPHLNVLIEGDYFPFEELNQAWVKATHGKGNTSFIRAADAGTVRELIKYVTKVADLLGEPEALDAFLAAVKGKRLVRTYGTFYGLPIADEDDPQAACCPDCKSENTVRLGYIEPYQVGLDFDGVLRIAGRSQARIRDDLARAVSFRADSFPQPRVFGPKNISGISILRRWDELHKEFAAANHIPSGLADLNSTGSRGN